MTKANDMSRATNERIKTLSASLYNQGLQKASIRDLSGSVDALRRSVKLDKRNTDAHNLLGLVYFEMGEVVLALQQWVVSQSINQNNLSGFYLKVVQDSPGVLDKLNSAIKKYNQAIHYIQQNSRDLAIISLKKVIGLNPRFINAYVLLSLCYYQEGQLGKAKKPLTEALAIDKNNYLARHYLDDILQESGVRVAVVEEKQEKDHHPGLIKKYLNMNAAILQFVSVIFGAAIGLALALLLVLPGVLSDKKDAVDTLTKELEVVTERSNRQFSDIEGLNEKVTLLETEKATLANAATSQQTLAFEVTKLLQSLEYYVNNEMLNAATALHAMNAEVLSDEIKVIYQRLTASIYPQVATSAYNDGYRLYNQGKYEESILLLSESYKYREDSETLYWLARAQQKANLNEEAIASYTLFMEKYSDLKRSSDAAYFLKTLQ